MAVQRGASGKAAHGAAKGGVIDFACYMCRHVAGSQVNIRINCVCPSLMQTPMNANRPAEVRALVETSLMGAIGEPVEVTAGIVFLLSD